MTILDPSAPTTCSTLGVASNTKFVFPEPRSIYSLQTSIHHWQLRDLIACPFITGQIWAVQRNTVYQYDTKSQTTTAELKDIGFNPVSMAVGYDYLAIGGQNNQLLVKHLPTCWIGQLPVGESINNAISIFQSEQGSQYMLICNNDKTVKVLTLPNLTQTACLRLPAAANYAAVSPDGKKLCAVGDIQQAFLYHITSNGSDPSFKKMTTLSTTQDSAFSVSWNAASNQVAVACQDGLCCVWDIRHMGNMLALCQSTQTHGEKKACRKVQFSPSASMDLLAFTEHMSFVNIVDARTFDSVQSIRLASPSEETHISGLSFSPDSSRLYVATQNHLFEFQVDSLSRRTFATSTLL